MFGGVRYSFPCVEGIIGVWENDKRKFSRVVIEDVIVYTFNLLLRMGQDFVFLPTHKFLFVVCKEGNVVKIVCFCLIFL